MWQERKNFLVERSSHFFPFPLWKVSWYQAEAGWETERLFWWNTELEGSISEDPRPSLGWGWGVVVIGEERVWGALLQTERLSNWPFIEMWELKPFSAAAASIYPTPPQGGEFGYPFLETQVQKKKPTVWLLGSRPDHPAGKLTNLIAMLPIPKHTQNFHSSQTHLLISHSTLSSPLVSTFLLKAGG